MNPNVNQEFLDALFARSDNLVESARREQERREGPKAVSHYVGSIPEDEEAKKHRIDLDLTLLEVLGPFDGQYGPRFGYVFHQTGTTNVVIWWSTGKPGINVGESDTFKCTIEKHQEYEGTRQTIVSRIKRVNPSLEAAKKRRDEHPEEYN